MMIQEFKKRVEKFMPAEEIERYADDFEPAYMAAGNVDKDDFCAVLKDERVRKMVASLAHELVKRAGDLKAEWEIRQREKNEAASARMAYADKMAELEGKVEVLEKQLSLIQSVCDRALTKVEA